jgi:hypothetical protein
MSDINTIVKNLQRKIELIGNLQMTMVTHLTENDKELQMKVMASILAVDKFRDDFTEWLNGEEYTETLGDRGFGVKEADAVKTFMIDINENIEQWKKEGDKDA